MTALGLFLQTGLDPKAIAAMARAYDDLLRDLKIVGRTGPVTERIAEEIVRVVQVGVRDPAVIRAKVLSVVRDEAMTLPTMRGDA